mgnify:CR=1 FL=1
MYDNIYLRNRISFNGIIKKKDVSAIDKILKIILWVLLAVLIIGYIITYLSIAGLVLTLDWLFLTLIQSNFLKVDLLLIILVSFVLSYCFRKPKNSVAFQIDRKGEMLSIVFNEGKWQGMEYHILLDEISNVCVYKNNSFSFYCNNIERDRKGKQKYFNGTISFSGGASGDFVTDFQNTFDRNIKYVNKKK